MPRKISSLTGEESRKGIGGVRTSLPALKVSLTLWRKKQSGKYKRQGGQHGGLDLSRRKTMVASTGEGMGKRAGGGINSPGVRMGAHGATIWLWKVAEKEKSRTPRCLA